MKKSYLLVVLITVLFVFASNGFAQMPTSLVPGSKTVLMDSRVVTHANDWTYLRRYSMQDGIFYEPKTGNLVAAFRQWDGNLKGSYIRAAISTDGGDNWTTYTELNMGLPNSTGLNVYYDCTAWGLSTTPIIAYVNRVNADANIQYQPTVVFDRNGWNGGGWFNIYVDDESDPDTICDYRYVDFIVAPDDPTLWLVSAWHSSSSSDPPGEQLVVWRSTDGGYAWSRPKCPISATDADQGQPRAYYNIMSSGLLLDMDWVAKYTLPGKYR